MRNAVLKSGYKSNSNKRFHKSVTEDIKSNQSTATSIIDAFYDAHPKLKRWG